MLTSGFALVAAPANADEVTSSYAEGQFLSGTLLGVDLAKIVALQSAEARNNGTQEIQTSDDPLSASVLQAIHLTVPGGIQTSLGQFVDLGAVNQYAEADKNGESLGASGAIGNDGAIGVGAVGSGAAGDVAIDLASTLGAQFAPVISDLSLSLKAIAAQASGRQGTVSGDYTLAGAVLTFSSPAIGDLTGKVNSALGTVDAQLAELTTDGGILESAVGGILNPVLGVIGSSADISVSLNTDLHGAVQSLLTGVYGNGAVHFNLQTGTVSVDLAQLVGGNLNNLPVNTELLSDAVINDVLTSITGTVGTLADQIVDTVESTLHSAALDVHAELNLLTNQDSTSTQVCHDEQVPIIGDVLNGVGGLLDGLTGGLTGGVTQGIVGYTTKTVCQLVDTELPALQSTVIVDIEGSVDQILSGKAAKSSATISLLGGAIKPTLDVNGILGGLGDGLLDGLFSSGGAVSDLVSALNTGLVSPAVEGLLGATSVDTALTNVLSVKVNVQETSLASPMGSAVANGSMFTQTAVRVSAVGGLATINLAAATVGPTVTTIVDPGCTTNCGPGNPDPGCTTNCGPGGPDGPNPPSTAGGNLAYTGVGIATLIAVILALLAAGAYLAREGYRRNHPQSLTTD